MAQKQTRRDPGVYCSQLDWWLTCAQSALGESGTTGAVIGAIERGGSSAGDLDFSSPMLRRIGWAEDGEPAPGHREHRNIDRAKRLGVRWAALPVAHQRVALALYKGKTLPLPHVTLRFGSDMGVVVLLWCTDRAAEREKRQERNAKRLRVERLKLQEELAPLERDLGKVFRLRSHQRFLGVTGPRALGSQVAGLLAHEATIAASGGIEQDIKALEQVCSQGTPLGIGDRAEKAILALHWAWQSTATAQDRPKTTREERQAKVTAFLAAEGL